MRSRPPERRLRLQAALRRLYAYVGPIPMGAWLLGCGGHALNVGSNDGGTLDAAETPALADFVNQQFPDGSNALTMTLDLGDGGPVTGTLLLGSGALLAPPTDPNVGYPPGELSSNINLVEGFLYTILGATSTGSHLSFQFDELQVWTRWCAIQTSYPVQVGNDSGTSPASYSCLPPIDGGVTSIGPAGCFAFDPSTMTTSPIDCGKLELCTTGIECQCSAGGCQARSGSTASVELTMTNAEGDGTLSGIPDSYEVQFVRVR
jgi:hypothetical protein